MGQIFVWPRGTRPAGVIEVSDESPFTAVSAATATIAAHIADLDAIAGWLAAHGIAPDAADRSVANTFAGLNLPVVGGETLGEHARHYATP
jgi:pyrroline-5-carboxylate reductase